MEYVSDYRRRAKECRELAKSGCVAPSGQIEGIAKMWTKMANEREKFLETRGKDKPTE
jgi:hypothetical protein